MSRTVLRCAIVAAGLLVAGAIPSIAQVPGTVPGNHAGFKARPKTLPSSASGLSIFYKKYGKYRVSVNAAGGNTDSLKIKVIKPTADAVVDKAFLMAASNGCPNQACATPTPVSIDNGDITLNGKSVTWTNSVFNAVPGFSDTFFNNVLGDVTSIVKPVMDAMTAAGAKHFTLRENAAKNMNIDGEVLVVVFKVPDATKETVALLFGAQQLAGDRFELVLDEPIDPRGPSATLNMGLGISFSYQENGTQQYSTITVNGQRVSTAAGGSDDGVPANGGLITVGGVGDTLKTPVDPNATPTNARSDDERYSLLKFITKKTTSVKVDTLNPSNDDNIFFAYFEFSAKGDINKDTDGDGLLDSWEMKGYDHDGDGVIDVNLPALGANYKHKDLFIAYAYMAQGGSDTANHKPSAAVLASVTDAFANAPVSNPDGITGIKVHWKNLGQVPFTQNLNITSSNWAEFDAIMDPLVSEAQRVIYHRLLFGSHYDGGNSSGISRGIPASDFLVTLPPNFSAHGISGTIMHELGHNLGLRHGNVDDENYKPNHLSIMSYSNQFNWLIMNGNPKLDYERFSQTDLDENDLNEAAGLSSTTGDDSPLAAYGVRWWTAGNGFVKNSGADKNVNWNNTGTARQNHVAVDINNGDNPPAADFKSVLAAGSIEWDKLIFDGGQIGASGGKAKTRRANIEMMLMPNALKELTIDDYYRMQNSTIEVK